MKPRFAALGVVALMAAILLAYWQTAWAMVQIWWRVETFTHAFLVPPIAGWLAWEKRRVLERTPCNPNAWFALPMLAVGAAWLLGDLVAVNALTQFALVAMLVLAVPLVAGVAWARQLAFPLGFLFFAVPVGEFAMPQFMEWTADFTVWAVRSSGIPVYREGLQFVIPTGRWSVVEACSGIRYLIASVTVGTLFAYLTYRSLTKRLLFTLFAFLVPIVANWLRAYMIVMLGHLSGNKLAAGVDHLIYGWVFFGVVIFVMFWVGSRWADPAGDPSPNGSATSGKQAGGSSTRVVGSWQMAAMVAFVVISMPPVLKEQLVNHNSTAPVVLTPPEAFGPWQRAPQRPADWTPFWENPSASINEGYAAAGRDVGLYVAYYRNQGYQRKLVSSSNMLVRSGDSNWGRTGSGRVELKVATGSVQAETALLRRGMVGQIEGAERLQVVRLYWVDGQWMVGDARAKLAGAMQQLRLQGDDAAVVVAYSRNAGDDAAAFLSANLPAIGHWLASTADAGRRP